LRNSDKDLRLSKNSEEKVSISVPGAMKYIHFINDAGELLYQDRLTFYSEELKQSFLQDMRIIMYELFSNAIQHSKSNKISVEFELSDDWLSLTFITDNIGFGIKEVDEKNSGTERELIFAPYTGSDYGREFLVYSDTENQVKCTIVDQSFLSFYNVRYPRPIFDLSELPEHYGLNLITKFSHEAYYRKNEEGLDCFTIRRRLK
jgi:anti-sigma regulatory factor (Ser/Thr protein kinase)